MRKVCIAWSFTASAVWLAACADPTTKVSLPTPDTHEFETEVYPVLLRDCGHPACHGDPHRFFRVFGPGRTRYRGSDTELFAPATSEEIELAYYRARSMLTHDKGIEHALLLRKPLHGGHKGRDAWGKNVYQYETDPGYITIARWARSQDEAAGEP